MIDSTAPLIFGIYPGGAAGTVNAGLTPVPEDPARRLAALEALRAPGVPFVLHLYASFTGASGASAAQQVGAQISQYEAAGFDIELVLCYRPADGGTAQDPGAFAAFARSAVSDLGRSPRMVSLQVTNEANVPGAPNASDGAYPNVETALVEGVIAAKAQVLKSGFSQLKIGFNWANADDPNETAFWSRLARLGGRAFDRAVDWVGLDAYPGTWGPAIDTTNLGSATATAIQEALTRLRTQLLPLAGLSDAVALHVSESGYPTGPGRTPQMQATALAAAVHAVDAVRGSLHVTDYRWFDLRDANSASTNFEDHYGLMSDTYSPKPAFSTYAALIASLGVAH